MIGSDAQLANSFFNDPVVRRANGPDIGAEQVKLLHERAHLRKDAGMNKLGEVDLGNASHLVFTKALVHLDHLTTYGNFTHLPAEVGAVAAVYEVDHFARNETGLNRPFHKLGAGVTRPKRTVAVKDGNTWSGMEDGLMEVGWLQVRGRKNGTHRGSLSGVTEEDARHHSILTQSTREHTLGS